MSKTVYKYTDVEIEIELEDVLDFIDNADSDDIENIKEAISYNENDNDNDSDVYKRYLQVDNLYDREKALILKKAFKKYNLEQLIDMLKITQQDAFEI